MVIDLPYYWPDVQVCYELVRRLQLGQSIEDLKIPKKVKIHIHFIMEIFSGSRKTAKTPSGPSACFELFELYFQQCERLSGKMTLIISIIGRTTSDTQRRVNILRQNS